MYYVANWLSNNYNTHISQYLTNYKYPNNRSWSVNGILQEKYFLANIFNENRARKLVKKALQEVKGSGLQCRFNMF